MSRQRTSIGKFWWGISDNAVLGVHAVRERVLGLKITVWHWNDRISANWITIHNLCVCTLFGTVHFSAFYPPPPPPHLPQSMIYFLDPRPTPPRPAPLPRARSPTTSQQYHWPNNVRTRLSRLFNHISGTKNPKMFCWTIKMSQWHRKPMFTSICERFYNYSCYIYTFLLDILFL